MSQHDESLPPLIEWSQDLSVGIQEIDDQHRVLVDLLNQINEAIHSHHGSDASQAILKELVDYTKIHFAVEESLMRVLGYPGYGEHKARHEELIHEVEALQDKLLSGKKGLSFELLHFLKMWLTKHILTEDMSYAPFFLEKGVLPGSPRLSPGRRLWQFVTASGRRQDQE
ncbi:hemerythrin family protein [Thiorhodococcus mannitoliphagus]|uniref:Hemerythrin family protein n=1 Tax=Thiorhodococcus mannitoliphagus TaxID=329406 RepID=A0A6P1DSV1_9GAMM|nr:bacteriohemerythrin [Thiorhodococcus mannitoliphagus]NEX19776.1 hemerythrin family protein [Thiorhodococcus mannitoliphagus]